jgi:hypothetical protein
MVRGQVFGGSTAAAGDPGSAGAGVSEVDALLGERLALFRTVRMSLRGFPTFPPS